MLRIIAILLNIGFLGFFLYLAISEGDYEPWGLFVLLIFCFLLNIFLIVRGKNKEESWFSLFLKRKAMEEKKKISELENKTK